MLNFNSPLTKSTNPISFNEASITTLTIFFNKTDSDGRYLKLIGGTLIGD
jgi:hypothetical protein